MCWQCDHPGATQADYLAHMRALINSQGWAVQGVQRDGVHPPWAYTVGLTPTGLPELVVTGLSQVRAAPLLNGVASRLLLWQYLLPGDQLELPAGPTIEVVRVAEPAAHLLTAVDLYGTRIRALQLVHADYRGRWPWESGYRGGNGGQPVLGIRTTPPATAA